MTKSASIGTVLRVLQSPARYVQFLVIAWRSPWRLPKAETDGTQQALLHEPGVGKAPTSCCGSLRVLPVVFGTAFMQYIFVGTLGDVLRYAVLVQVMGSSVLIVGSLDTAQAVADTALTMAGLSRYQQRLVSTSPRLSLVGAAAAFLVGAFGVFVVARQDLDHDPNWIQICGYFLANLILTRGTLIYWMLWSSRLRKDGLRAMEKWVSSKTGNGQAVDGLDVSAKVSQIQVTFRYLSSGIGPILVAVLLTRVSAPGAYLCFAVAYACFCLLTMPLVSSVSTGANQPAVPSSTAAQEGSPSTMAVEQLKLSWFDVLPSWCGHLAGSRCPIAAPAQGQLFREWIDMGLFCSLTEAIRGGYTRVLALSVLSAGLSVSSLAHVVAVVFWTAASLFWLSDLADDGRRAAALVSFALLGLGHAGLGLSTDFSGFLCSALLFGLGEAFSTGLRALVGMDYIMADEGILAARYDRQQGRATGPSKHGKGYFDEEQRLLFGSFSVATDITGTLNGFAVGVIGSSFGMRATAATYALLSAAAVAFSALRMPETKPPHPKEDIHSS